ncbi:MAG: restriction endonuclease subunit R, partial [Thermoplasmata archaeon]|nr:restriction endonuclease subunit R [Thermoplasmata archaeon]
MEEPERITRKNRVDARLRQAGWKVIPYDPKASSDIYANHAVEEYPTESGPADYALFYHGKILGIVEAKKLSLGPQNVIVQAQRYAKGISQGPFNFGGFRVPFVFSTNGEIIWFQDLRPVESYSRRISNFHTPDALWEMLHRSLQGESRWFQENPNEHPMLRHYQIAATK